MSTKIYNAYKFTNDPSLSEVQHFLNTIRQKIAKYYKNLAEEEITLKMFKDNRKLFEELYEGLDAPCSLNESCVVYTHTSGTYVQFFVSNKFLKLYKNKKDTKDYHYQNQSDPPENVAKEEWDTRLKVWEDIFTKKWLTPNFAGFTYQFYDYDTFVTQVFTSITNNKKNNHGN